MPQNLLTVHRDDRFVALPSRKVPVSHGGYGIERTRGSVRVKTKHQPNWSNRTIREELLQIAYGMLRRAIHLDLPKATFRPAIGTNITRRLRFAALDRTAANMFLRFDGILIAS